MSQAEQPYPPTLAARLLRWRLPADEEELIDSLDEVFAIRIEQFGLADARRLYWRDVLDLCVFGTGRKPEKSPSTAHMLMYSHYLKIAWRALRKQKGYAFMNTAGLALGLAICLLVFLFVQDEWTVDRFHQQADRIYRVNQINYTPDGSIRSQHVYNPFVLGSTLVHDLPEVEQQVSILQHQDYYVRQGEDSFEESFLVATEAFFEVFSFPLVRGDAARVLQDPNGVVLTETTARKYFGESNPIGQTLSVRFDESYETVTVTGVAADPPSNSSILFDFVLPYERLFTFSSFLTRYRDSWDGYFTHTYVLLAENADVRAAEAKLADFRLRYHGDERDAEAEATAHVPAAYTFQALTDVYLDPTTEGGLRPSSNPLYSYILGGIALIILVIACINFMTLAIGRSAHRAREVGIRKVIGARRSQVIEQFLGEAMVLTFAGSLCGLLLAWVLLPMFNQLADKQLAFAIDPMLLVVLCVLFLFTGLLAGSYPAFVLSALQPISVFKNKLRLGGTNRFTKSLVTVQFAISVFLIATTLVMLQQMDYLRSAYLGFNHEHVIAIPTDGLDRETALPRFHETLRQHSQIAGVTLIDNSFAQGGGFQYRLNFRGTQRETYVYRVDQHFVDVLDLELVAGRDFDPTRETDVENAVLVNEALVRAFELEDPIGQQLTDFTDSPETDPYIIGVFEDYNFRSLYSEVAPLTLTLRPVNGYHYLYARLQPNALPETIAFMEATWAEHAEAVPFTYTFIEDDMQAAYAADARWSTIVRYAAFLAIFIACLGLLGLTAYTTARRTKEIGVRKVMGASVVQVIVLLLQNFVALVLAAFVLAAPLAYVVMQRWLDTFAFRIDLSLWVFGLSGVAVLLVALLTASYQALRAAHLNPVDCLRTE